MKTKGRAIDRCATSWELSLQSENKSDRTIDTYLTAVTQLTAFLDAEGMPTNVAFIEREHVEAYITSVLKRSSDATASVRYRALQQFFRWLLDEGEIDESPMMKMRAPKVHEKSVEVFDGDEIVALLRSCDGSDFAERRDTAIIRLLDDSGMRRAELCGLDLDDVSLSDREAHVIGKGGKPRICSFGTETARALDRYLRVREEHRCADLPDLWLGHGGPMTGNGIGQMLRRRGAEAGVENVHAHRFRHTMAHEWKLAGGNESALMAHAGWTSRSMLDRYGKSSAQALAKEEFQRVRANRIGRGRR